MHPKVLHAFEQIDADIFGGDSIANNIELAKEYIARWIERFPELAREEHGHASEPLLCDHGTMGGVQFCMWCLRRRGDKAIERVDELEDALRYCRGEATDKPSKAWAPAITDRVNAALKEGAYRLAASPSSTVRRIEERRIEERLVVTDLCDMHAFNKEGRLGKVLRRAINFIEGKECFPPERDIDPRGSGA